MKISIIKSTKGKMMQTVLAVQPANAVAIPQALAVIAYGRDHIKTSEFAHALSRSPQTILKNHCLTGECFGIRPIKQGKFLLWPVAELAVLLNGGA